MQAASVTGIGMKVTFQFGMHKEELAADDAALSTLTELAALFVSKCFPDHRLQRIHEHILLFRHDAASHNLLQLLASDADVPPSGLIEVVLAESTPMEEAPVSPHVLAVHSYKSPHFCDYCGEMLFGIVRQGLKCDGCGRNFHKRCAYKIPNNCPQSRRSASAGEVVSLQTSSPGGVKVPHTFVVHNYTKPTICQYCRKLLYGIYRQGFQCKDCCYNVHRRCARHVNNSCIGEPLELTESEVGEDWNLADAESPEIESSETNDENQKPPLSPTPSSNIPLMRVIQSVKHKKGAGNNVMREAWMVHHTAADPTQRRHFWRLDTKAITLFCDERSNRYYKEMLLSDIAGLTSPKASSEGNAEKPTHVFEIHMSKGAVYLVGESEASKGSGVNATDSGLGREPARHFESAIRNALMPVTTSGGTAEENKADKNQTNANSSDAAAASKSDAGASRQGRQDINSYYKIFADEILGSGQFGIVYGAKHRHSGHDVAIKVIDKQRFPTKQEEQLKNEVKILHDLCHPGVINLERTFETEERIFVVMEKMQGDMLEMILSSVKGRLSERVTKFLTTQILVALKYLHSKSVVHCDLKPENVLLAYNSPFPLIKLCDFGFARLIGEKSFRRSIVGTPAYLAPEVLKSKGYNRSIDVWSVGVIVYVSLSGTFPFNEDEEIQDQIRNAVFMYPPNPWKEISPDAISLINCLLEIKLHRRYSLDKCFSHSWLQDYNCWCDLRRLEHEVGLRFITYECEDARWEEYQRSHGLPDWPTQGWNKAD